MAKDQDHIDTAAAGMFPPSVIHVCPDCPPKKAYATPLSNEAMSYWTRRVRKRMKRLLADTPHHLHRDLYDLVASATSVGGILGLAEAVRAVNEQTEGEQL